MKATLCRLERAEFEIKKSRFLVAAGPVDSAEAAAAFIVAHADADARHNCFAWRVGDQYRFFDADEPAGTAGRPILQAIDGQGLDQIAVLVTRWFGGIKLGAGGLVRAYGGSAAECLRLAERRPLLRYVELRIWVPFAQVGAMHHLMQQFEASKVAESFDESGCELQLRLLEAQHPGFVKALTDLTRGQAAVRE